MSLSAKPVAVAAATALTLGLCVAPARAAHEHPLAGTVRTAPEYPFRDPSLPLDRRVDDLLGRLTTAEKVSWLHQYQPAVERLGIGLFKTGTEALHGVAWSTDVDNGGNVVAAEGTVFPQAVGLASTWNPDLVKKVGTAVGEEARGYHAENPRLWGLQLWTPVVNPLRDPRWGPQRGGLLEDPLLTGAISTAYGSGIQGDDPDHLRAAPVLKHFLGNNNEVRRDTTSSSLRPARPARVRVPGVQNGAGGGRGHRRDDRVQPGQRAARHGHRPELHRQGLDGPAGVQRLRRRGAQQPRRLPGLLRHQGRRCRRHAQGGRRELHGGQHRRRPDGGRGERGAGAGGCSPRPTSTPPSAAFSASGSGSASSTRTAARTGRSPRTWSTVPRTGSWPGGPRPRRRCC
ncbi:glycoside hydrolase family 3 N-terminal domain-containing protein [Streptosporangium vulgare]|uniref:glycoside hydrolase family 3 N-terminal domain-containing protein n=1 Tax=Streptosporangium vulgare TaxID=46190 RepID=UPI0031D072CB